MGLFRRTSTPAAPTHRAAAPADPAATAFDAPTTVIDDISGDYTLDASHSRIGFSARHAMVTTVRGAFRDFEGTAHLDTANPAASSVRLAIRTESVDTGSADRDGHLRSGDFLDHETHPEIAFSSTAVELDGETWLVTGDLTVKGVTHAVTVPFEQTGSAQDPFGNTRVGFEGVASLNRRDWGLSWNAALETGGVLVSEKIRLELDISAIKTA